MKLKLEVVLSSSIKRKKPWPRFCWLGQEKESVFLLDDKRISEINMVSGRTKKKTPKLHHLLNNVVTMAASHNGMWLCGLLASGELFLWNRDKDVLKTAAAVPEVVQIITSAQANSTKLCVQVSCEGTHVLLVTLKGQVILWECTDTRDFAGLRDGPVKGHWMHIQPLEDTVLPSSRDKEASQHTVFVKTEVMGDVCLSAFVFTSGKQLILTVIKIQWKEANSRVGSAGFSIQWATKTYPLSRLSPPCHSVKSRGALVPAFSPDGQLLAVVLNQRNPQATQVLFVSTQNFISISCGLGGCGSKKKDIPSKYIRSYWVGSVCWSPGGLFLACVLKRGSLLMLASFGGLLTLTSSGCNLDFGPVHFLPLHPLVTYRPPVSAGRPEASLSSSSLSVRDILRQRYSVTWHPRLLYLIVSDGYMATVLRMLDRPSPALFLNDLLKDVSKDLEKASSKLGKSQVNVKAWLESVSSLNLDGSLVEFNPSVTRRPKTSDSIMSAATDASRLPLFLRDQQSLGGTKELFESMQAFFEDESDLEGIPAGSHVEDGGHLEFSSMFDTLHALETYSVASCLVDSNNDRDFVEAEKKTPLQRELGKIRSRLLTAWAFGMLLGDAVEHRAHLLKHTLCCVVRFAALLHLRPSSTVLTGEKKTPTVSCLLHLIKALLSLLSWDRTSSDGPCCLGLLVEFSKRIVLLLLTPHPDLYQTGRCLASSQSLSRIMTILQLISDSLDRVYSLQQKTSCSSEEKAPSSQSRLWNSDVYHVPMLQKENTDRTSFAHQALPVPHRPSSRLLGVWQLVYDITQQYAEELTKFTGCDGWEEEEQKVSVIMTQIQTALQATGGHLQEGPSLLSHSGEHDFLCGLYPEGADAWRLQICQEANKSCDRSVFQETRLCLALLYSLLSQYSLKEAQELGDHMAQMVLLRAGNQNNTSACSADSLPCPWLPMNLHTDAACAVLQTLGRFMASYFTNQPLFILPAHNVAILPPLHLPQGTSVGRLVPLSQEDVARAVRQQHLSELWTVDYALDLLLLGGLLPEAVWLAYHLGDWKTAVTLSLAYTSYCSEHLDFTAIRKRELHLPTVLQPESIFQAELDGLVGNKADSEECLDKDGDKNITDPLEGDDWNLLQASLQEILKASVMAGVDVMSSPLSSLLDKAKDTCSSQPLLVPTGLYLPSPPLYCPQPSPNTQDQMEAAGQFGEVSRRHKVSGILQRLLLLLRSARCSRPAAQWYVGRLRRARHILHKIKKKYSYPAAAQEETAFPEELVKLISRRGYFKQGPKKGGRLDPDTIHAIVSFRELCALCWMLHVRDQLSLHCRKYQAARQRGRAREISEDSELNLACIDAVLWACRLLPFCHFLNAEEVLQDLLLSLLSELPPLPVVADSLSRAFPQEVASVRVSLRDKYNLLLQRLKQSSVFDRENEEVKASMATLIKDKNKLRRKHLARLQRHLAPPVLHLWEKEEDEEDRGSKHNTALGQMSLGTSIGTLTDGALQPVCSDAETSGNTSGAISPEQHHRTTTRSKKTKKEGKKLIERISHVTRHEDRKKEQPSLPVIGTWEFELEDQEYLSFLELFLSYVLAKDSADGGDSGSELPLLRNFCSELRERELHSLTFDVLTTIHRRLRDGHPPERKHLSHAPPVFSAGSCYKPVKQSSSVWNKASASKSTSISSHPTEGPKGLFGLRRQNNASSAKVKVLSPVKNASSTRQLSDSFKLNSSVSVEAVTGLQQGLDPKLEAQFPELGRLLEWMVRWADRRVLLGKHGKKKKDDDEGVVIRVRASAPAILTSLRLLERTYSSLLQPDRNIQVPGMQWTVAPVQQPEVDVKLERESSVDTGYPGSANTPIAALDHLQQAELGSPSEEPTFQGMLPLNPQSERSSPQHLSLDELDVPPEKEAMIEDQSDDGKNLHVLSFGSSKDTSGNICTSEMSLKLEDLDYSEKAEDLPSSSSSCPSEHPEASAPPPTHPKTIPDSSNVSVPHPAMDPPNVQPQSCTDSTAFSQPLISSPVRQRLGEDLFRLVQHINYMSLHEVLGASFSNLHRAQQSHPVASPEMSSLQPKIPPSFTNVIPEPNVLPVQTAFTASSQAQECLSKSGPSDHQPNQVALSRFAVQNTAKTSTTNQYDAIRGLPSDPIGAGGNYQELQPISVQAESPDLQQRVKERLIPSSQGLLATTDSSSAIQNPPMLVPPVSSAQNVSASQTLGLKLLRLHPPVKSQDRSPQYPPAQQPQMLHSASHKTIGSFQPNDPATWKKRGGEQRNDFSVPARHLQFNPPPDPPPRNSLPHLTVPARLLQLQHVPQSNISFPRLTQPFISRPAVLSVPLTGAPMTKLLHIESGPQMVRPQAVPPTQITRLPSMEELTSSKFLRRDADEAELQLLRVDPSTETTGRPTSSSSKRQKRREEREKGRKKEVTFRPNDSIILTQEAEDVPVHEEPAVAEVITPGHDITGSSSSLQTGQRLLDQVYFTSAELHAFASTCKQHPERHDASTNTDQAHPPVFVDKAVSVQSSVMAGSPRAQSPGIFQMFSEVPVRDTEEILDAGGRQFFSVLDLEDPLQCETLPPQPSTEAQHVPSSPTSAQLHALPTAAIRAAGAEPRPSVPAQEDGPKPRTSTDIPEEPPLLSHYEPHRVSERLSPQEDVTLESPDSEICRAIKTQSLLHNRTTSSTPSVWFSSRLLELDAQLADLQNIADHLERDFSNSRMLVNKIETLSSDRTPKVRTTAPVKKTVRLTVPVEAWTPRSNSDHVTEPKTYEEKNEEHVLRHGSTSLSQRAGPSSLHTPQGKRNHFSETHKIWHESTDENLGETELSDTLEILDELVKEGYLSSTDWNSSTSSIECHSRQDLQQSSWTSQKPDLPGDQRKELRIWMRRKQRERLAAYQKHRENLRQMEHKPFSSTPAGRSVSRNQGTDERTRKEKEKIMLLKQYNRRTSEACSLVADFLTSPENEHRFSRTDGPPVRSSTRPPSAPPLAYRARTAAVGDNRRLSSHSGQLSPLHRPQLVERYLEDLHRRLGLYRPVTFLPKDRLSQVTRRGMLSNPRSQSKHAASQNERQRDGNQRMVELNKTFSSGAASGRLIPKEHTQVEETEVMDHIELSQPQHLDESDVVLAELLGAENDGVTGGVSEVGWLDNLSGSAGSTLSKIDWAAIERMVAEEET
ncbi:ciliogenesis and planar polarity effector 1 isoform X2 [Nothobranchius furzeri]|uniref:Transcript variant X2 n=1 Tax=Nothobranchius furzeri TaxID=105023 RepID=A0A8C6LH98_NOTFU|nr:transcript variant X2 [Nothobranchius furzeri]